MADKGSEPRFDSNIELVGGGYDQGVARAQRHFGWKWFLFKLPPLAWESEDAHYEEENDCFEIGASCSSMTEDAEGKGKLVYHISPDGRKLLPGTPLIRSALKWRAIRRRKVLQAFWGMAAVVIIIVLGIRFAPFGLSDMLRQSGENEVASAPAATSTPAASLAPVPAIMPEPTPALTPTAPVIIPPGTPSNQPSSIGAAEEFLAQGMAQRERGE